MSNHVQERVVLLNKEIAGRRRATNWSSNIALLLGLIIIIALCAYFGYGYKMLDDITKPDTIVQAAKAQLTDVSIEARKVASEEIRKSAPVWATEASKELVNNIPSLREKAEVSIETYFNDQIAVSQTKAGEEFKKIIDRHRDDFKDAINLMVEEGNSDEFVEKILPIVEKSSEIDLKDNAMVVMGSLKELNERLDKLARGEDLNPLEKQQRHILGLTRIIREDAK